MNFLRRAWAEIDTAALIHNFKLIKNTANCSVMAVVKADAYGHSVADVAPVLDTHGADAFAVSNLDEALQLRELNISKPILILGFTPIENVKQLNENNITQCVYSAEYAKALSEKAVEENVTIDIHIKLDTGMSRIGFNCRNNNLEGIEDAVNAARLPAFKFKGLFTHFAVADRNEAEEDGFTDEQYKRFTSAVNYFKLHGLNPDVCHSCNSAALCLDYDKHLDYCRPGIILYGLTPSSTLNLQQNFIPVMTLKSVISMVKEIDSGDTVSYGRTFKAYKKTKIATVAIGYADGYPRLLSNKGYVIINGQKAPVVGRVCMDQITVDVTDIENVKMGDEVILFGKELPVEYLAEICNTINYEIICGIAPRVPRVTINN